MKPEDQATQKWTLLGKQSPQNPQAFYNMDQAHNITTGTIFVSQHLKITSMWCSIAANDDTRLDIARTRWNIEYLVQGARCVYNSTERDQVTFMGPTHNDEMCNFYMMYYADRPTVRGGWENSKQFPAAAAVIWWGLIRLPQKTPLCPTDHPVS